MADFSYQGLVNALTPQVQSPTPLMDGLAQQPSNISPLDMMRAKQSQQQDPRNPLREINPGASWGGRDRNMVTPNDVMDARFFPQSPEQT